MKKTIAIAVLVGLGAHLARAQSISPLTLQRSIALPAGTAKFDHFAIDLQANRLFIGATGNHTVQILDLNTNKVIETITGLGRPRGLAWIPATQRLYASDGSQGDLKIFEGSPFKQVKSIMLSEDADDMVYEAKSRLLYVGHGGSDAANPARVAVIDTTDQNLIHELPVCDSFRRSGDR
jgi:YVTN family beta-propeller protein